MKTIRLPLLLACAFLCAAFPSATAAETKIGTIDLKKIFEDYYKTKLAQAALDDEVNGLKRDNKALMEDHAKAVEDYKKTIDEANNQAISADEREKKKKEAEGKMLRIGDLKQTIEQFERTAATNLKEKHRMTTEKILNEIKEAIQAKSKAGGFSMVLDSSAAEPLRLPTVLYTNGDNDLTSAVLATLNANAPADLPKSDPKKDEKK